MLNKIKEVVNRKVEAYKAEINAKVKEAINTYPEDDLAEMGKYEGFKIVRDSRGLRSIGVRNNETPMAMAANNPLNGPTIFVNQAFYDIFTPEEQEAVLAHEAAHHANGDCNLLEKLGPLAPIMMIGGFTGLGPNMYIELAADAGSVKRTKNPLALASALRKLTQCGVNSPAIHARIAVLETRAYLNK